MTTEVRCMRCGQAGHLPANCSWPLDTEDIPEPPPPPEPNPAEVWGGLVFP